MESKKKTFWLACWGPPKKIHDQAYFTLYGAEPKGANTYFAGRAWSLTRALEMQNFNIILELMHKKGETWSFRRKR